MSTRLLVLGSNSLCTQLGICNNGCFLRPDTGLSFCTGEPPPRLKSHRTELQSVPITLRDRRFLFVTRCHIARLETGFGSRVHLAVWQQPHKTHWGRHSRDPSIQYGTGRCMRLLAASTILHFYMEMSHTSEQDSKKGTKKSNLITLLIKARH